MRTKTGKRILALVTDAHGGHGGISQYNRDVLEALCRLETVDRVHVCPRIATLPIGPTPTKLRYHLGGIGGLAQFAATALKCALTMGRIDVVYCAHINLVPVARALSKLTRAPIVLAIYGIDAWQPVKRVSKTTILEDVDCVISISALTRDRFVSWCPFPAERIHLVPNAIRLEDYGLKQRNETLLEKYRLSGKTVLMTLGRMVSEERAKGFDEVIELLPQLAQDIPDVIYLMAGDGNDRKRLEAKAADLGVKDRVVFTGHIDEGIKADLFRLADVYVMPSHGEGFGFVILEALASGIPVVASSTDGTREAIRDGQLGVLVDPNDPQDIRQGIHIALKRERGVPDGLAYFSFDKFSDRLRVSLGSVCRI